MSADGAWSPGGELVVVSNEHAEARADQLAALGVEYGRRNSWSPEGGALRIDGAEGYFDEMSLHDNLTLGGSSFGSRLGPRLTELVEQFRILERHAANGLDHRLRGLVCLVRALHLDPPMLMVADVIEHMSSNDWTAFLDLANRRSAEGRITAFSLPQVRFDRIRLADRFLLFRGRRLMFSGRPNEISPERARMLSREHTEDVTHDLAEQIRTGTATAGGPHTLIYALSSAMRAVFGERSHIVSVLPTDDSAQTFRVHNASEPMEPVLTRLTPQLVGSREMPTNLSDFDVVPMTSNANDASAMVGWLAVAADSTDPAALSLEAVAVVFGNAVDEYQARERAVQATKDLSRAEAVRSLVGGIAHDFNNSLQTIAGSAEVIEERNTNRDLDRIIRRLRVVAGDAQAFVSKLLAFSRVADLQSRRIDFHAVIRDAVDLVQHGSEKLIEYRIDLANDEAHVVGDEAELRNVFVNLLLNSAHAVPERGGRITVASHVQLDAASDTDTVVVSIADNGPGIPEELADRVFQPFLTTRERSLGTGMGLAVALAMMQEHGGELAIQSTSPAGTTMVVTMPMAAPGVELPPAVPSDGAGSTAALTVMICDDNEDVRFVLADMLEMLGHRCIPTEDGQEALREYQAHMPEIDVCVVDQLMPGMKGDEVIARLRAIDPSLPCISLSGFRRTPTDSKSVAANEAADILLTKPVGLTELSDAIASAIAARKRWV